LLLDLGVDGLHFKGDEPKSKVSAPAGAEFQRSAWKLDFPSASKMTTSPSSTASVTGRLPAWSGRFSNLAVQSFRLIKRAFPSPRGYPLLWVETSRRPWELAIAVGFLVFGCNYCSPE
jgi:hypothetical protein